MHKIDSKKTSIITIYKFCFTLNACTITIKFHLKNMKKVLQEVENTEKSLTNVVEKSLRDYMYYVNIYFKKWLQE